MKFSIYHYDPDTNAAPRMQDYDITLEPTDHMLLDLILRIKMHDDSLTIRRSCREGVGGSDAVNINGRNGLGCITPVLGLKEPVVLRPLPSFPVIRDLVVDMRLFFKQYHSIRPRRPGRSAAGVPIHRRQLRSGHRRKAGRAERCLPPSAAAPS